MKRARVALVLRVRLQRVRRLEERGRGLDLRHRVVAHGLDVGPLLGGHPSLVRTDEGGRAAAIARAHSLDARRALLRLAPGDEATTAALPASRWSADDLTRPNRGKVSSAGREGRGRVRRVRPGARIRDRLLRRGMLPRRSGACLAAHTWIVPDRRCGRRTNPLPVRANPAARTAPIHPDAGYLVAAVATMSPVVAKAIEVALIALLPLEIRSFDDNPVEPGAPRGRGARPGMR